MREERGAMGGSGGQWEQRGANGGVAESNRVRAMRKPGRRWGPGGAMRAPRGSGVLGWGAGQGNQDTGTPGERDAEGLRGHGKGPRRVPGGGGVGQGARGGPRVGVTHINGRHLLLLLALGADADAGEVEGGDLGGLGGQVEGEGAQRGPPRGAPPVQAAVGASDPGGHGRGGGRGGGAGGAGVVLLLALELWGELGVSVWRGQGRAVPGLPGPPSPQPPELTRGLRRGRSKSWGEGKGA